MPEDSFEAPQLEGVSEYQACTKCGHLHTMKDNFCEKCGQVLPYSSSEKVNHLNRE